MCPVGSFAVLNKVRRHKTMTLEYLSLKPNGVYLLRAEDGTVQYNSVIYYAA